MPLFQPRLLRFRARLDPISKLLHTSMHSFALWNTKMHSVIRTCRISPKFVPIKVKRMLIIIASILWFRNPMTSGSVIGCVMVLLGGGLYNYASRGNRLSELLTTLRGYLRVHLKDLEEEMNEV